MTFEYKVVPAPTRGRKVKGVKTPADRFARALEDVINELAAEGWEYLRTDTLPAEERQGLTGRTTVYQNMLVFRRGLEAEATVEDIAAPTHALAPALAPAPAVDPRTPRPVAPAAPAAPAAAPAATPPTEPSSGNTLDTMIANELAAARAPKLPSAGAAQDLTGKPSSPTLSASRKDVAAE